MRVAFACPPALRPTAPLNAGFSVQRKIQPCAADPYRARRSLAPSALRPASLPPCDAVQEQAGHQPGRASSVSSPCLPHGAAGRNGNIHSCGVNLCCVQRCCMKHNAGGSGDFPAPSAASSRPGKLDVHYRPDERIMEVPWLGRG